MLKTKTKTKVKSIIKHDIAIARHQYNDVMKVCYDNFWRSDESVRLQCEFDIPVDAFSGDIKDIVFNRFYNIAVNVL